MDLDGAVAVVTGGASGIGRACAVKFAAAGADVVIADVNASDSEACAEQVRALGRQALPIECDVSVRTRCEELVRRSILWKGHCDVFMSNAGVGLHGPPHKIPLGDWEWAMDINVWPHVWATRTVLPHMLERGRGHLVHTASAAGLFGLGWFAPYCLTKFAVVGLAESLHAYCAGTGVNVSVVCPGYVVTNLGETSRMTFEEPITADQEARLRVEYREVLEREGIPPEQVGDAVVAAVLEDRFWVFPHEQFLDLTKRKWEDPEGWMRRTRTPSSRTDS